MLFTMVFIAVPFLVVEFYVFSLPAFKISSGDVDILMILYVTIGFLVYSLGISILVVWLKILHIDSLKFNIPITLFYMVLMITYGAELYYVITFSILAMLMAIPTNIFITKYKESKIVR